MATEVPPYLKSIESLIQSGDMSKLTAIEQPAPMQSVGPTVLTFKERDPKKLQFLLVSTHCHQFTGYSKVSWGMVQQLAKLPWLQVSHYGFQKIQQIPPQYRPYPSSVDVIDAASIEKPFQQGFGFSQLPEIIRKKDPHVVMIYNDMSVVARFLEEIRKSGIPRKFKIWVYCDQVYPTQLQGYLDILNRDADCVFAFSNYWKK
jgi:hypothetical protein